MTVTPANLDSLLDLGGTIDTDRASLLITWATNLCAAVVTPVPDNADPVVAGIAARAYLNPGGVQSETIGPQTVAYGSSMVGLYLTASDMTTLKRMAGVGGAFTVDPTPSDAGTLIYPWDQNIWYLGQNGDLIQSGFDMPADEAGEWQ